MIDAPDRRLRFERERTERVRIIKGQIEEATRRVGLDRPVVLELCCGHGHFLADRAAEDASRCYIGVDYCSDRIERARRKQARGGWGNLQFLRAEVFELLEAWPESLRVESCFVLFPDPWPKKRHSKNRVFCSRLLDRLSALTVEGATLYFRTDASFYFEEALQVAVRDPAWELHLEPAWPFGGDTVFQRRAATYRTLACVKRPKAR
ncbi:hypothetical protein ASA1KI_07770 [Opitutales bacterium ASA1]|uniref:tRNA (guanine(46)-N(7))-methyltransferase TrmB n=1 Tax=Congregicoccus parvus TaxID=3081749 RepID=UPI002B2D2D49|nr:hypothetical protein ASA1KI_07770 [Opitutales bacterium ASA1]